MQSAILSAIEAEPEVKPKVRKPAEKKATAPKQAASPQVDIPLPEMPKINLGSYSAVQKPVQKPKADIQVPKVNVGDTVFHKKFGEGTISFMDQVQTKLRVQFKAGEKLFVYPDAFVNGYLKV